MASHPIRSLRRHVYPRGSTYGFSHRQASDALLGAGVVMLVVIGLAYVISVTMF